MFEKAARLKYRFESSKGLLTVEDLWDLPLTSETKRANLDDIARELHKQLKSGDDISFVYPERKSNATIQAKFDIVKHIIDVKLLELEAAKKAEQNKLQKQKILRLISEKDDEVLRGKSREELTALLEGIE
ncbi:MAG: hypothetical protein LBT59_01340 [Clostridiales bacterium]|jgi:hypothetical protein|nr:hypothetical protein [Clostridiales bacterium]